MRYTYGTIAAVTCAILILAALWPQPEGPVMQNLVAQTAPPKPADTKPIDPYAIDPANPFQGSRERLEAILAQTYQVEAFQMPLRDVLDDLSVNKRIPFYFEPGILGDVIDPDLPIDMQFRANSISIKTLLDFLLLESGAAETHGYTIRDNIIVFTEKKNTTEVSVYNCRDLLMPNLPAAPHTVPDGEGASSASAGSDIPATVLTTPGAVASEGVIPRQDPSASASAEQQLIQVISNTVAVGTWNVAGVANQSGGTPLGSIDAINGLIVVKHTPEVHKQVENLLKLLREAKDEHGSGGTIFFYPRQQRKVAPGATLGVSY